MSQKYIPLYINLAKSTDHAKFYISANYKTYWIKFGRMLV